MVKVGFICEGDTEKIFVDSDDFDRILKENNIEKVDSINLHGVLNLIEEKRIPKIQELMSQGANYIITLRDKDDIECFTKVKSLYDIDPTEHFVIAQKEFEAWFLADPILKKCLGDNEIYFEYPENISKPFEVISKHRGSGITSKPKFAKKMIRLGFSIENAANHPNCNSAKYFIHKLKEIGQGHEN